MILNSVDLPAIKVQCSAGTNTRGDVEQRGPAYNNGAAQAHAQYDVRILVAQVRILVRVLVAQMMI